MSRRVYCAGYGKPCPGRIWWYTDRFNGARKRCPTCAHRVARWLELNHATACETCGAPLPETFKGRPRVVCSDACYGARRAASRGPEHISAVLERALGKVRAS
jgi:hypothetical protein